MRPFESLLLCGLSFFVLTACSNSETGTGAASNEPVVDTGQASPNILLIAVDDMGYDTPASFGGRVEGLTPHIDALASQGMRFTNVFAAASVCAPSRAAAYTGLYPQKNGLDKNHSTAFPYAEL